MLIIGCDPGVRNFGAAVSSFANDGRTHPLLWAGKVKHTLHKSPSLSFSLSEYKQEMADILTRYGKPDVLICERFMNRGRFSGDQGEYVSMMNALTFDLALGINPNIHLFLVSPATWKNAFNLAFPTGGRQKTPSVLQRLTDFTLIEPHELDAILMTHYAHGLVSGTKPFSLFSKKTSFILAMEKMATGKKKRKRK